MESKRKDLSESISSKRDLYYNKLVPKILDQSNKLTKELKNRIKLNTLFSKIESKASNQFKFFIKESKNRYMGSKSGSKLDSLIANSRKKCLKEANKILNDKFYSTNEIAIEKEKMKLKTTNKIYKRYTKTLWQFKNLSRKNITISFSNIKKKNIKSQKDKKRKKRIFKDINNLSIISSEIVTKGKQDINILLNDEKQLFLQTMANYKNRLNAMSLLNDKEKYSYAHKNMCLTLPSLKLLSYKKYMPSLLNQDEEEILNRVNFKKLVPYSRSGKYSQKKWLNKNKANAFITEPIYAFSTHYGECIKNSKNTNDTVFNAANKEFNMECIINQKRKKIDDILGINNIPQLKSYKILIKDFYKKKEKFNNNNNNKIYDIKKEEEESLYDKSHKILKGLNTLKEMEENLQVYMQDSFNNKKDKI